MPRGVFIQRMGYGPADGQPRQRVTIADALSGIDAVLNGDPTSSDNGGESVLADAAQEAPDPTHVVSLPPAALLADSPEQGAA